MCTEHARKFFFVKTLFKHPSPHRAVQENIHTPPQRKDWNFLGMRGGGRGRGRGVLLACKSRCISGCHLSFFSAESSDSRKYVCVHRLGFCKTKKFKEM